MVDDAKLVQLNYFAVVQHLFAELACHRHSRGHPAGYPLVKIDVTQILQRLFGHFPFQIGGVVEDPIEAGIGSNRNKITD